MTKHRDPSESDGFLSPRRYASCSAFQMCKSSWTPRRSVVALPPSQSTRSRSESLSCETRELSSKRSDHGVVDGGGGGGATAYEGRATESPKPVALLTSSLSSKPALPSSPLASLRACSTRLRVAPGRALRVMGELIPVAAGWLSSGCCLSEEALISKDVSCAAASASFCAIDLRMASILSKLFWTEGDMEFAFAGDSVLAPALEDELEADSAARCCSARRYSRIVWTWLGVGGSLLRCLTSNCTSSDRSGGSAASLRKACPGPGWLPEG